MHVIGAVVLFHVFPPRQCDECIVNHTFVVQAHDGEQKYDHPGTLRKTVRVENKILRAPVLGA